MVQIALVLLVRLQQISPLLVAGLVLVRQLVDGLLVDDVLELPAVEAEPVEILVIFERLGGAACEVVALSSAVVREDGVCECDLLELLVCCFFLAFGSLVW